MRERKKIFTPCAATKKKPRDQIKAFSVIFHQRYCLSSIAHLSHACTSRCDNSDPNNMNTVKVLQRQKENREIIRIYKYWLAKVGTFAQTKLSPTVPFYTQTSGMSEWAQRTIKDTLHIPCGGSPLRWDDDVVLRVMSNMPLITWYLGIPHDFLCD